MTNRQMRAEINRTAKVIKKEYRASLGKMVRPPIVDVNWKYPYVSIRHRNKSFFFQGEDAEGLLTEADQMSIKFNTSMENTLLYISNSWG